MQVKHKENGRKGTFYIEKDAMLLAELTYTLTRPEILSLDHTEVSDNARGMGLGNQLVDAAVSYSRDNQLKILPICSFARSVFLKTPAYRDVLLQ